MPDVRQVVAQLDTLNKYFGHYTLPKGDFPNEGIKAYAALGVDVGIQFALVPTLTSLTGVDLVKTDRKSWDLFNQIQDPKQGGIAPVDPAHIINIWIGELAGNNAGYAHLPGAPASWMAS